MSISQRSGSRPSRPRITTLRTRARCRLRRRFKFRMTARTGKVNSARAPAAKATNSVTNDDTSAKPAPGPMYAHTGAAVETSARVSARSETRLRMRGQGVKALHDHRGYVEKGEIAAG